MYTARALLRTLLRTTLYIARSLLCTLLGDTVYITRHCCVHCFGWQEAVHHLCATRSGTAAFVLTSRFFREMTSRLHRMAQLPAASLPCVHLLCVRTLLPRVEGALLECVVAEHAHATATLRAQQMWLRQLTPAHLEVYRVVANNVQSVSNDAHSDG